MKTKVFIIPGLSDNLPKIAYCLNDADLEIEAFIVGWRVQVANSIEYFEERLQILLGKIDIAYAQDYKVVLIGLSAGCGFAINAFSKRESKISKVINIAGRLTTVKGLTLTPLSRLRRTAPIFIHSIEMSEAYLDNEGLTKSYLSNAPLKSSTGNLHQRFVAFVPLWDELVPLNSMSFEGAHVKRIFMFEHLLNIYSMFTIYKKQLLKELLN